MIPPFITKIFAGKAGDIIKSITDGADKLFTSKEQRAAFELRAEQELNRHLESIQADMTNQYELQLKDVADSRQMNSKIQESSQASWMAKNVGYLLDIFIVSIWAILTFYIAGKYLNLISTAPGVDFSGVWGLYASVTGMATVVLSWHRGSSKGSEDKQRTIERLSK